MRQNAAPRSFDIAGKVFVLGEYAVLQGYPAIVAALGPRFRLEFGAGSPEAFAPASPAGKLCEYLLSVGEARERPAFRFRDPYQGAGGFGASTAQFALVYAARGKEMDWRSVWTLYRELTADAALPPSGADLIAQWRGGVTLFNESRVPLACVDEVECSDLGPKSVWPDLLVFAATEQPGRKTATHEHLAQVVKNESQFLDLGRKLEPVLSEGLEGIRLGDTAKLGSAMILYAEVLASVGLETPAAREDRETIARFPGVLGVKGAGALLSDAVLVLLEPGSKNREEIIATATGRGLKLVADGLKYESGVAS